MVSVLSPTSAWTGLRVPSFVPRPIPPATPLTWQSRHAALPMCAVYLRYAANRYDVMM
ncbi:hypothetical protein L209DRAFT_754411 [Thermothelomyces heterothallicus CBS 203.75]